MQRVGHFEFGLDRRPLNLGDADAVAAVQRPWRDGREVEGWSLYWASLHTFLADRLDEDAARRRATLLVRFEDLCADPSGLIASLHAHDDMTMAQASLARSPRRIPAPSPYALTSP